MKVRFILLVLVASLIVACGEEKRSLSSIKNTPEYNMLAADSNISGIWGMNMLGMLEKSAIEKLDFGMMGDMAIGMVNKMSDKNESGIDFSGNAYFIAKHDEAFKFDYSYTYYSVTNRGKVYGTLKSSIGILIAGKHGSEDDYDTYHTERGTVGVWDNDH
ncbi:MAG: hypothetical protein JKY54_00405, partial [Flavobacteriales bacterium]|nr:hypothetical protein [Flavobacteriales bacterium]